MKGIILAGGSGTRLFPVTKVYSKQLMYLYDKPMIYYPITTLLLGGIREILIISTPQDLPNFQALLGDGSQIGVRFEYAAQPKPEGLAQAFIIGESFVQAEPVCLILGDNLFYGYYDFFREAIRGFKGGATIFGYVVNDPQRYGVVEFDPSGLVISIEEKPSHPKSNYAVPGLYIYDEQVVALAKALHPSARGELEITDLNRCYLEQGKLNVKRIGRGVAWLDTGTPKALLDANNFIGSIEMRQGLKIGCIEEAALRQRFITATQFEQLLETYPTCDYRAYLERILKEFRAES